MGQALLTKGCTKDLLERLKVVYELAGFPGKAIVEKSGRGTCTEHKSASCSIPRGQGEVAYGKAWLCTGLLHCPSSMAGSWPCSRHPQGVVCFGLLWVSPSSACQVLLFLCYPLQVQPGAAALCLVGVQGLGGECRCPAQCFGCTPLKAPLLPSQAPAMGEVKCCCCCKGPDGSTKAKP